VQRNQQVENPDNPAADAVIEAYKRDVDRTLIREQLRRSVDERVQNMIAALRLVEELRRARAVLTDDGSRSVAASAWATCGDPSDD
jgi:hypothetical protein